MFAVARRVASGIRCKRDGRGSGFMAMLGDGTDVLGLVPLATNWILSGSSYGKPARDTHLDDSEDRVPSGSGSSPYSAGRSRCLALRVQGAFAWRWFTGKPLDGYPAPTSPAARAAISSSSSITSSIAPGSVPVHDRGG